MTNPNDASNTMSCGHPQECVTQTGHTHYCRWCAEAEHLRGLLRQAMYYVEHKPALSDPRRNHMLRKIARAISEDDQ